MRLAMRSRRTVGVWPMEEGEAAAYPRESVRVTATVMPSVAGVASEESGLIEPMSMALLLPADCPVRPGDALALDGGEPAWICREVRRWANHCAVTARALPGRSGTWT